MNEGESWYNTNTFTVYSVHTFSSLSLSVCVCISSFSLISLFLSNGLVVVCRSLLGLANTQLEIFVICLNEVSEWVSVSLTLQNWVTADCRLVWQLDNCSWDCQLHELRGSIHRSGVQSVESVEWNHEWNQRSDERWWWCHIQWCLQMCILKFN